MQPHREYTDDDLEAAISRATLPGECFTHEAHLRLAWIHIRKYGPNRAAHNLCEQIKAYAASLGATDKFNHTVTVAAVMVLHDFMAKDDCESFDAFLCLHPDLQSNFKGLISTHYSFDVFSDPVARQRYIEPDCLPFTTLM